MVLGMGSLSVVLHLVAGTAGLSVPGVLAVLVAGHVLAGWRLHGHPNPPSPNHTDSVSRILELAAVVTVTAVVVQWALLAPQTAEVSGSDAAHYHVPNAVNLALGGSPFDLPPTSHLYPMGSSMLAAWFILPVETTLLTDLVMLLPFLLLVASAGWLFRQLTFLSGLAWSTWMILVLFATPLFRSASLMSADLLFAAASIALCGALLTPLLRRRLTLTDIWLIGSSLGLLLGSKVTGFLAAALLGVPAAAAFIVLKVRGKISDAPGTSTLQLTLASAGSLALMIGAGGVWLLRNWWIWGSPVAPNGVTLFGVTLFPGVAYESTTYLSVLGDMSEKPGYSFWDRTAHFMRIWLGPWYLPAFLAAVIIPIDYIATRARGSALPLRLAFLIVVLGTGAVLTKFLTGAPWTSLEWTDGFSLRYALPWLVLLPIVAWLGVFPAAWPWYRKWTMASVGGLLIVSASLIVFAASQQPPFPPLPSPAIFGVTFAILATRRALQYAGPRWPLLFTTLAVLAASFTYASYLRSGNAAAQQAKTIAMAAGPRTAGEQIYDAALTFEGASRSRCDAQGRRFFITNRFDEAGALQGPRLTNQVFYAARDVKVTARVRRPMGPCDYLITERAIMDTTKGAMLHAALNPSGRLVEVATVGDVTLLVHR
jgi:hypothetical protein